MHIFYTPDISSDTYQLNEEESRHCVKVLRLQKNDQISLVNGRGTYFEARIVDPHPKKTVLEVIKTEHEFGKRNHHLHIAIAPTKNIDRLEWFLEKATEIGIDEISPLLCERSERKEIKRDRLNKVITSAMKQSLKAYHPTLHDLQPFSQFLVKSEASHRYIAHCMDVNKSPISTYFQPYSKYIVLIGPEGDFSPAELQMALEADYIPVSLGESRLRTETAALESCFEINYLNR